MEVPGLIVKTGRSLLAVHAPDTFMVEDPRFSTRTAVELQPGSELNEDQVHVVPFVFNVPFDKLIVELNDLLAFKLTIAPAPLIVIAVLVPVDVA